MNVWKMHTGCTSSASQLHFSEFPISEYWKPNIKFQNNNCHHVFYTDFRKFVNTYFLIKKKNCFINSSAIKRIYNR